MPEHIFLDCRPQKRSARARNLQDSFVKSHIARQVHSRRRQYLSPFPKYLQPLPCSSGSNIVPANYWRGSRTTAGNGVDDDEDIFDARTGLQRDRGPNLQLVVSLQLDHDKLAPVFFQVSEKATRSFSGALRVKNIITPELFTLMSDEAFFHSGAALIKHERQNLLEPGRQTHDILLHRSKALRIIQQRLQKSRIVDNATLLAILFLPMSEYAAVSLEELKIHWTGLSRLIAARREVGDIKKSPNGGCLSNLLDSIGPYAMLLLGIDIPHSDGRTQAELTKETKPTLDEELELAQACQLPPGFRKLVDEQLVGVCALRLLKNYLRVRDDPQSTLGDQDGPIASDFQHSYSRLHTKTSSVPNEPGIEHILYDVLALYTAREVGPTTTVSVVARSFRQYSSQLIRACDTERSLAEERALYWCWTVLVLSWQTLAGTLSVVGADLLHLQAQRFPHWVTGVEGTDVLKLFFYDKRLLDDYDRFMRPFGTNPSQFI